MTRRYSLDKAMLDALKDGPAPQPGKIDPEMVDWVMGQVSRNEREYQVRQMLANQRLEGLEPDQAHQQLLQEYIDGTASLDDLLRHAQGYAYEQWFRAQVQEAIDDPRPSIPHDQVMAEVRALIERKRQR